MIVLTAKHLRLTEASSRSVTVRQKITLWSDFPSYEEFDDATSSDGQPLHFRLGAVFHPLATFFTAGAGCLRWVSIQSNRVSAKNVWQTVFFFLLLLLVVLRPMQICMQSANFLYHTAPSVLMDVIEIAFDRRVIACKLSIKTTNNEFPEYVPVYSHFFVRLLFWFSV